MFRSIVSLLTFFIFTTTALGAAIPSRLEQWSTPVTCLRELAEYDFRRCSTDLNDLIRVAHDSLTGIELIGMRLIDVIGPGSSILPEELPVTHTCYPTDGLQDQSPEYVPQRQYTDDEFVPFRLNLSCDDRDVITSYSWH